MAGVTVCSYFGAQENKICHCFHFSPTCLPWSDGLDAMNLVCLMLISSQLYHSLLSLSSRGCLVPLHFLPLEWYHLHIWDCWSFSQQSVCDSSSPAFHMIYSAYNLNQQGGNIQPWHTPFPMLNQSAVPCLLLTVAFWLTYWFLRRKVRCSDILISLRIFHFVMIHTVKGFTVVNEKK